MMMKRYYYETKANFHNKVKAKLENYQFLIIQEDFNEYSKRAEVLQTLEWADFF